MVRGGQLYVDNALEHTGKFTCSFYSRIVLLQRPSFHFMALTNQSGLRFKRSNDGSLNAIAKYSEEYNIYLLDRCGQRVPLCTSDLYLRQLAKLDDGLGEIQDVVAALKEAVETHEEGVVLEAREGSRTGRCKRQRYSRIPSRS